MPTRLGLTALVTASLLALAADAPSDPVVRRLTAQTALASARQSLAQNRPADAALTLEAALPYAEGDAAFLAQLQLAYRGELALGATEARAAVLAERLRLLTGVAAPAPGVTPVAGPVAAATPAPGESLLKATQLFQEASAEPGKFALAAECFASAFQKVEMSQEQLAAWAFCRVRLANDQLERGAAADAVRAEVEAARKLAPQSAPVQERAQAVLARLTPTAVVTPTAAPAVGSPNFRLSGAASAQTASLLTDAEAHRKAIHTYWTGRAPEPWATPCEVVLHADAAALQAATGTLGTSHATVTFEGGAVARRLHFVANDPALTSDQLPRELTHLVLADLFPNRPPPHWAEVGMAAVATSAAEQGRYLRTLDRLAKAGATLPAEGVLAARATPADRATAFHVESLALVQYLASLKGGPAFVEFLSECDRYGAATALKNRYGVGDIAMLESWGRSAE